MNKFYENGTVVNTETLYCRLNIKAVADLALEIVETSASAHDAAYPTTEVLAAKRPADRPREMAADPLPPELQLQEFCVVLPETDGKDVRSPRGERRRCRASGRFVGRTYETGHSFQSCLGDRSAPKSRLVVERAAQQDPQRLDPSHRNSVANFGAIPASPRRRSIGVDEFELQPQLNSATTKASLIDLSEFLANAAEAAGDDPAISLVGEGVTLKPPGLPTASVDRSNGKLIGMHVDNWFALPLETRRKSPNRLSA